MKLDFSKENWVVDPAVQTAMGGERIFKVVQARGGLIADVSAWYVSKEAAAANAQLIATAPKMLRALEKAEAFIAGFEDDEAQEDMEFLKEIRAAIAAAKGES